MEPANCLFTGNDTWSGLYPSFSSHPSPVSFSSTYSSTLFYFVLLLVSFHSPPCTRLSPLLLFPLRIIETPCTLVMLMDLSVHLKLQRISFSSLFFPLPCYPTHLTFPSSLVLFSNYFFDFLTSSSFSQLLISLKQGSEGARW